MKKNLVCIDVETTGLDKKNDVIIQIAAVKVDGNTLEKINSIKYYIKPTIDFTISEGAYLKHGLTKEFILENGKTMKEIGQEFIDFIEGCDILSYNGNAFDMMFLDKDIHNAGFKIDWSVYDSIDVYNIECQISSRKLENVYKKYTGKDLVNTHDAYSDVMATIEVYKYQREIVNTTDFISKIISPDGLVRYDKLNQLVFTFGKYNGIDVCKVCKSDPQYIKWLFENGISETTKNTIKEYYKLVK